ncbi:MAG: hypothetical protein QXL83_07810 [Zestosphaera sp.]
MRSPYPREVLSRLGLLDLVGLLQDGLSIIRGDSYMSSRLLKRLIILDCLANSGLGRRLSGSERERLECLDVLSSTYSQTALLYPVRNECRLSLESSLTYNCYRDVSVVSEFTATQLSWIIS